MTDNPEETRDYDQEHDELLWRIGWLDISKDY